MTRSLDGVLVAAGVVAASRRAAAGPGPLEVAQAVVELRAGADDARRACPSGRDAAELEAGQLVDLPVGAAEVGADVGEAQGRPAADVDVAAAGLVDPLVGPHRARAVAPARAAPSGRGRGSDVAGRPQQQPAAAVLEVDVARAVPIRRFGQSRWPASGPSQGFSAARRLRRRRCRAGGERPGASERGGGLSPAPRLSRAVAIVARPMSELPENFQTAPLAEVDPEIAGRPRRRAAPPAAHPGDDRLGELRAAGGARSGRLGADQQVRRGLPRPPLLRRLRGGRRRRGTGDRAGQGAVRRRARQRPGPRRRPGQQRRLHGADRTGRHDPRARARPRRPPQPRDEDQRLRQALQPGRLPRPPRGHAGRHGRGRARSPRSTSRR